MSEHPVRGARNDLAFVRAVIESLDAAGVRTWLFGGWAEELRGLSTPRAHRDVDLLCPAVDLSAVDAYLAGPGSATGDTEIVGKHFAHKRAFDRAGVMVELFWLRPDGAGGHHTDFWGRERYTWPDDVLGERVDGLRVASVGALRAYRAAHPTLAYEAFRP